MVDVVDGPDDPVAVAMSAVLHAYQRLVALPVPAFSPSQQVTVQRGQELLRRMLDGYDNVLIAGLSEHIMTGGIPARNAQEYLVDALLVPPRVATARVRAAVDVGPGRTLTGQSLAPMFPHVAAAQSAGAISVEHARVIRKAITSLTPTAEAEFGAQAEATLVDQAARLNPQALDVAAHRLVAHLDPDGRRPSEAEHQRRRTLWWRRNADGSSDWQAHATPELTAKAEAVFGALTQPRPTENDDHEGTTRDTRSPAQRNHDAFEMVLDNVLRSDGLPTEGGLPATVSIIVPLEVLEGRVAGVATTSRGQDLTVTELLRVASEAQLIWTTVDRFGAPIDVGYTSRYCTPHIRRCVNVRDRGCVFPGCTIPAEWCEAHHVIPWVNEDGPPGETKVDNIALLCSFHHRTFERWNWYLFMDDGIPTWIPPSSYDPERRPLRNTANHLPMAFPELAELCSIETAPIGAPD